MGSRSGSLGGGSVAARYDHIDFTPPAGVKSEAQKGLDWRREFGRGGTAVGVARARDLSNGTTISPETARRMKAYFDRHEIDKQGEGWSPSQDGFPSNGRIAWALWGGDSGYSWSKKLVRQMNAADEDARSNAMNIERRSLAIDEIESAVPLLAVESRSEDGAEREWVVGYAAKFGVLSLDLGDFVERIDPGACGMSSPCPTRPTGGTSPATSERASSRARRSRSRCRAAATRGRSRTVAALEPLSGSIL